MTQEEIEMFGEAVPGEAVVSRGPIDPCEGYTERGRYARRSDGKAVRVDNIPRKDSPVAPMAAELQPVVIPAPHAMSVYDCIVAVSADMAREGISKGRSNTQQNYKFRGIDDVLNALSPMLAKHRLVILPRITGRSVVERETRNGGALFYVTVEAEFDFVSASDGSKHTVKTYGEAMDSADKATNKAMSAAYKYAAFQTFCIPTEGDNDADQTTHDVKPPARPQSLAARTGLARPPSSDGAIQAHEVAQRGTDEGPDLGTADPSRDLPIGYHLVDDYHLDGEWHQVSWGRDAQGGSMVYKTKLAKIGLEAAIAFKRREPVRLISNKFPYLDKVEKLGITRDQLDQSRWRDDDGDQR